MRLLVSVKRFVSVNKAAKERLAKCMREGLCPACLEPLLPGQPTKRGAHVRCYHATFRAVRAGKTTWAKRVAEGKIGEAEAPGRKPSHPVSAEFA
jgi:hypothetical protein